MPAAARLTLRNWWKLRWARSAAVRRSMKGAAALLALDADLADLRVPLRGRLRLRACCEAGAEMDAGA